VIIALGDIYAQIPRREQVSALMRALQDQVRVQPGCESYAFAETLDDPRTTIDGDLHRRACQWRAGPTRVVVLGIVGALVRPLFAPQVLGAE
jgi:hypothetical protein